MFAETPVDDSFATDVTRLGAAGPSADRCAWSGAGKHLSRRATPRPMPPPRARPLL